jgi:hypothetical protein
MLSDGQPCGAFPFPSLCGFVRHVEPSMVSNCTPQWDRRANEARPPTGNESCGETDSVAFESDDEHPPASTHTARPRDNVVKRGLTGPKVVGNRGPRFRLLNAPMPR